MNGLSGLVSFAPSSGGLFSVQGGNYKIPISAWKQAALNRQARCSPRKTASSSIEHVPKQVTSVISKSSGEFELWSWGELLGVFETGKKISLYVIHFGIAPSFCLLIVKF
jgi:hypothetical protein